MKHSTNFYITEITDDLFTRIAGKSYKTDCKIPRTELAYLHVLHTDFSNTVKEGELICNCYIAKCLLDIFQSLYEAEYQIEKVRLIDEYEADDELSMRDNNSSCFNYRTISHTTSISKHGLGLAVDINPLYNPYVKSVGGRIVIEPENAVQYADRTKNYLHKIDESDLCYQLFTAHGFLWGGSFTHAKDYQHFELPSEVTKRLYQI